MEGGDRQATAEGGGACAAAAAEAAAAGKSWSRGDRRNSRRRSRSRSRSHERRLSTGRGGAGSSPTAVTAAAERGGGGGGGERGERATGGRSSKWDKQPSSSSSSSSSSAGSSLSSSFASSSSPSSPSSSASSSFSSFSSRPPPGAPVSTTLESLSGEKCMPTVRNTPTLYAGPLTLGVASPAQVNAACVAASAAAALAPPGTAAAAAAGGGGGGTAAAGSAAAGGGLSPALLPFAGGGGSGRKGTGSGNASQSQPPPPATPPPPSAAVGRAVPSSTALQLLQEKQKLQLQQKQDQLQNASPEQMLLAMKINDVDFDRKQRRLYVGNLPPGSTQPDVVGFFNGALLAVNAQTGYVKEEKLDLAGGKDKGGAAAPEKTAQELLPVERCEVFNESSRFCFIELRNQGYTILCIKLDGINYNGFSLRVGRPHDYIPPPGGDPAVSAYIPLLDDVKKSTKNEEKKNGATPPRVDSGADTKIYVQNLPPEMGEEQVRDLFEQLGKLRVLNLIKNVQTGQHKGYGFFEYENPEVTDQAIMTLNGFVCGANILSVQRANFSQALLSKDPQRLTPVTQLPTSMTRTLLSDPLVAVQVQAARRIGERPSKVVQLLNCVYQEDMMDAKEYESLLDDIKQEAEKHGRLEEVLIPRPNEDLSYREGVGKVFLRYSDVTAARKAQLMLNGRRFDGTRVVCAAFFPEDKFASGRYTLT